MNTNERIKQISTYWSIFYKCSIQDFEKSGTQLNPVMGSDDDSILDLITINERAFLEYSPVRQNIIDSVLEKLPPDISLSIDLLRDTLGEDNILVYGADSISYLLPELFVPHPVTTEYEIKQLKIEDAELLEEMYENCDENEIDSAKVEINHPVIFGILHNEKLVAASSFIYWGKDIADIGVIVHPQFREKGLGKAVVTALCQNGIESDKLLQFRNDVRNIGSGKIASSLGFKEFLTLETFEIKE